MPYVVSETLGRTFGVSKLPYGVLIAPDGRISSLGLVNNREHLESLFEAQERGVASIQEYLARR
jgi:methylamine dehydrogenase accessory protein MauD